MFLQWNVKILLLKPDGSQAMCGNNLVNGVHVCENNFTENTILREWGGFEGWVCSDYRGTRSTVITRAPPPPQLPFQ